MTDVLLGVCIFVACLVVAVVVLAARDARRRRLWHEARPLVDRIADIRSSAAFMADQLQKALDRPGMHESRSFPWMGPVLAYYRRLEALASASGCSVEEIENLAEQANDYVRQHRLKGVSVAQEAKQLAALVRRRQAC